MYPTGQLMAKRQAPGVGVQSLYIQLGMYTTTTCTHMHTQHSYMHIHIHSSYTCGFYSWRTAQKSVCSCLCHCLHHHLSHSTAAATWYIPPLSPLLSTCHFPAFPSARAWPSPWWAGIALPTLAPPRKTALLCLTTQLTWTLLP